MTVTILKICNGVNGISDMANLGCGRDGSLRRDDSLLPKNKNRRFMSYKSTKDLLLLRTVPQQQKIINVL